MTPPAAEEWSGGFQSSAYPQHRGWCSGSSHLRPVSRCRRRRGSNGRRSEPFPTIRRPDGCRGSNSKNPRVDAGLVGGLLTVSYLLQRRPSNLVMGLSPSAFGLALAGYFWLVNRDRSILTGTSLTAISWATFWLAFIVAGGEVTSHLGLSRTELRRRRGLFRRRRCRKPRDVDRDVLSLRTRSTNSLAPSGLHNWRWPARRCRPAAGISFRASRGVEPDACSVHRLADWNGLPDRMLLADERGSRANAADDRRTEGEIDESQSALEGGIRIVHNCSQTGKGERANRGKVARRTGRFPQLAHPRSGVEWPISGKFLASNSVVELRADRADGGPSGRDVLLAPQGVAEADEGKAGGKGEQPFVLRNEAGCNGCEGA